MGESVQQVIAPNKYYLHHMSISSASTACSVRWCWRRGRSEAVTHPGFYPSPNRRCGQRWAKCGRPTLRAGQALQPRRSSAARDDASHTSEKNVPSVDGDIHSWLPTYKHRKALPAYSSADSGSPGRRCVRDGAALAWRCMAWRCMAWHAWLRIVADFPGGRGCYDCTGDAG